MCNRSPRRLAFVTLVLLALAAAWSGPSAAAEQRVEGTARWSGEVRLKGTVLVAPGAVLTVAPGTVIRPATPADRIVVQGVLKVEGTAQAPVRFVAPKGWQGIEFVESPDGSVLRHAEFQGAQAAVSCLASSPAILFCSFRDCEAGVKLLRESGSRIEDCLFSGNQIGIDNEMKSFPVIRRNRFLGQGKSGIVASNNSRGAIEENLFEKNKQAVGLHTKYPDRVAKNRFIDNETALFCYQSQNTPLVTGNLFEKNQAALVNFSFAYPAVEENRFIGNQTAVRNDQFGSARIVRNLFRENGTALFNNRKSNPQVEKNLFEKNGLALFVDYSSYPKVRDNNFIGNKKGVELGIYQSADWEKRSGSRRLVQEEAQARGSRNPLIAQAPNAFEDFVDVRQNWWGEDTRLLAAAGPEGNVAIFFDRRDKPKVTYEGYGQGSFVLDWVRFHPWLEAPVADVGPK